MEKKLPPINQFNIRIYGLLVNDKNQLLVSDEVIRGQHFTKFPGGGLEFEESPLECLHREFLEEMNQSIEIVEHFNTTDQFIRSAFRPWEQVICMYYKVKLIGKQQFEAHSTKFDFDRNNPNDQEAFRWENISDLNPKDFSFLSDSYVIEMINKNGI